MPRPKRPAFDPLLAQHRRRLGLTQEEVAERLGISAEMVRRHESGRAYPGERLRRIYTRIYSASEMDLGLSLHPVTSLSGISEGIVGPQWLAPAASSYYGSVPGGSPSGDDATGVLKRVHQLSRTIDPDITRQLSVMAEELIRRYEELIHADILPLLVKQRAWVDELIGESNHLGQRRRLLEIAAETSGLLGYLAVGRSNFQLARAYCAEAFKLGEVAESGNLQAWARGLQSFCEYYSRDYEQALRFAQDGLAHAKSGPQSVRLAANGVARAMGKLGDADGVRRAVDHAYACLSCNQVPDGFPSSVSLECYSAAQAASNAATAYVSLGMWREAEAYIDKALPGLVNSTSPWSRSLIMLDQASSLVLSRDGDLEHAARLAMDAIEISAGRPIVAVHQRASEFLRDAVAQWGDNKQIRSVREALTRGEN